jgi:hypothetical protein
MPNLDDSAWEMLLDRIGAGKCTPFLGAGSNWVKMGMPEK